MSTTRLSSLPNHHPKGFAFWFATHVNPRIRHLSSPEMTDTLTATSKWCEGHEADLPSVTPAMIEEASKVTK